MSAAKRPTARRRRPTASRPPGLPDVRDGLTRTERVVLAVLHELKAERGDRPFSTLEVYGRVVERVDLSPGELHAVLARLAGR